MENLGKSALYLRLSSLVLFSPHFGALLRKPLILFLSELSPQHAKLALFICLKYGLLPVILYPLQFNSLVENLRDYTMCAFKIDTLITLNPEREGILLSDVFSSLL